MDPLQINELCNFALNSDMEARSDLVGGYIASENDYTSNFTGALRRKINSNSKTGLRAHSQVLHPPDERLIGCDATIIVSSNGYFKIAMFEAKQPRFSQSSWNWDYAQTASGISHFSDQLQRQQQYNDIFAIFEMFYCDMLFSQQPQHLQSHGSSCVWHSDAISFDHARNRNGPWSRSELDKLLSRNLSIDKILREVCTCQAGKPIEMWADIANIAQEYGIYGPVLHVEAAPLDPLVFDFIIF